MERRGFIGKMAAGAGVLATGIAPFALSRMMSPSVGQEPERNHLRPPGALKDDAAFVSACIGCGLCGEVCPPKCIQFHARDGGAEVNTPFVDPEAKACTLCGKCMDACPTASLSPTPLTQIDMGTCLYRPHGVLSVGRPRHLRCLCQRMSARRQGDRL